MSSVVNDTFKCSPIPIPLLSDESIADIDTFSQKYITVNKFTDTFPDTS